MRFEGPYYNARHAGNEGSKSKHFAFRRVTEGNREYLDAVGLWIQDQAIVTSSWNSFPVIQEYVHLHNAPERPNIIKLQQDHIRVEFAVCFHYI